MFANGSCLPERSARRSATVTSSEPLATSASRINSFDANFPVPTSRRDANSRSAIFSFEGLSAMDKDKRIHEHARMPTSGERRLLACYRWQLADDPEALQEPVLLIKSFSAGCRKGQAGSLRSPESSTRRV